MRALGFLSVKKIKNKINTWWNQKIENNISLVKAQAEKSIDNICVISFSQYEQLLASIERMS